MTTSHVYIEYLNLIQFMKLLDYKDKTTKFSVIIL